MSLTRWKIEKKTKKTKKNKTKQNYKSQTDFSKTKPKLGYDIKAGWLIGEYDILITSIKNTKLWGNKRVLSSNPLALKMQ